ERAVVLSSTEIMDVNLLPETVRTREIVGGVRLQLSELMPPGEAGAEALGRAAAGAPSPSLFQIMEEVERRVIVDMLERCNWNQTEAAERFLIPLSTLNQKIKRLHIDTRRRRVNPAFIAPVPAPAPPVTPAVPATEAEAEAEKDDDAFSASPR
ncbi:MAG: helix-turn-helix domain-containing protein, partial [Candidatus Acidiferrales bacterium]